MFNYPPSPLLDEHVSSLIYRAFQQNCYARVETWCTTQLKTPFFDKPQRFWVPVFHEMYCALSSYYSQQTFLNTFTNVGDYTLFLSLNEFEEQTPTALLAALAKLKFENGLHVTTDRTWRYCACCAREDEVKFGTSYFHVSHQHFYKRTCDVHDVLLEFSNTQDFSLPPINMNGVKASNEEKSMERKLLNFIKVMKLVPSHERKARLLCLLKQKLGLSELVRLKDDNFKQIRRTHKYFAGYFNQSSIKHYFEWSSLIPGRYPLEAQRGLMFMLDPKRNLHPMLYVLLAITFLNEEEQSLVADLPFRPENTRAPLPLTVLPHTLKASLLGEVA